MNLEFKSKEKMSKQHLEIESKKLSRETRKWQIKKC